MDRIDAFAIDHVVLTVRDVDASCDWYERALGMRRLNFDDGRAALHFGSQKIQPPPGELAAWHRTPRSPNPAPRISAS